MTPEEVRAHLVAALEADLVGPFIPDEEPGRGEEVFLRIRLSDHPEGKFSILNKWIRPK